MTLNSGYCIAVIKWSVDDTISDIICDALAALGHQTEQIRPVSQDFSKVDIVFSYGPYGSFLTVPTALAALPYTKRPIFVHWNTEGLPNLKIPWRLLQVIGAWRSWIGRLATSPNRTSQQLAKTYPIAWLNAHMFRYRYLGDYYYAHRQGWIDVFADSSLVYGKLHHRSGLPTLFVPWGAAPRWYDNLNLERDIDVLWMGNREGRRHKLLQFISNKLRAQGIKIYIADGIENPFIHDRERTELLNRSKITLNLTRTTYDDNFSRFSLAAPNRSLIVSETVLPHCPMFETGKHYVSTPVEQLVETILYYLQNDDARLQIIEQAYQLVTTKLTFSNSMKEILNAIDNVKQTAPAKTSDTGG
jgi:hypothetical protein